MSNGPILKDGLYYGFWLSALVVYLLTQGATFGVLWMILREVRK